MAHKAALLSNNCPIKHSLTERFITNQMSKVAYCHVWTVKKNPFKIHHSRISSRRMRFFSPSSNDRQQGLCFNLFMNEPVFALVWEARGPKVLKLLNQDTFWPRKSNFSLSSSSTVGSLVIHLRVVKHAVLMGSFAWWHLSSFPPKNRLKNAWHQQYFYLFIIIIIYHFLPQVYSCCSHMSVSDPVEKRKASLHLCESSQHWWAQWEKWHCDRLCER